MTKIILLYLQLLFSPPSADMYLPKAKLTPAGGVKLNLNYVHQKYNLSCEASALTMVLNYHDISIKEDEVIAQMPFDKTKKGKTTWGDPDEGFVGEIDGLSIETGYGIYWRPMAKVASRWKKTAVLERASRTDLTYSILKGWPVIIWVYDGSGSPFNWTTPKGKKVVARQDEHAVIAYGFEGSEDHPMGFYIMDPDHGPTFWDTHKLDQLWESFNRSGIVLQDVRDTNH